MSKTITFSVLVNGEKKQEFKPSRGIREGYPISPYLFLLVVEGQSCVLKASSMNDNVRGVMVSTTAPAVNHLLFVANCLLMFKANLEGQTIIRDVIQVYCNASGQ